jgi:hypothetical protein
MVEDEKVGKREEEGTLAWPSSYPVIGQPILEIR